MICLQAAMNTMLSIEINSPLRLNSNIELSKIYKRNKLKHNKEIAEESPL